MRNYLLPIGLLLLFIAIAFIIIGSLLSAEKTNSKVAVGGIIGFIPFGFATDKKLLWFVIILTAVLFIFLNIIRFIWR